MPQNYALSPLDGDILWKFSVPEMSHFPESYAKTAHQRTQSGDLHKYFMRQIFAAHHSHVPGSLYKNLNQVMAQDRKLPLQFTASFQWSQGFFSVGLMELDNT